jgi:hypothetical protein
MDSWRATLSKDCTRVNFSESTDVAADSFRPGTSCGEVVNQSLIHARLNLLLWTSHQNRTGALGSKKFNRRQFQLQHFGFVTRAFPVAFSARGLMVSGIGQNNPPPLDIRFAIPF